MATRAQIKRQLQTYTVSKLRTVHADAAAECQRLSPLLGELEETAPDSDELLEVRDLFDEVCTRAQEATIEIERRSRVGRSTPAPAPPVAAPPPPPESPYWPPPWWAYVGAAGIGLLALRKTKMVQQKQAWAMRQGRKIKQRIKG